MQSDNIAYLRAQLVAMIAFVEVAFFPAFVRPRARNTQLVKTLSEIQSQKKVFVRDLVNFVTDVASLYCLNLPAAFSQPRKKTFLGSV